MRVLMISGDPNLLHEGTDAHSRLQLQKSRVERLEVVVIVRGKLWRSFKQLLSLRKEPFDVITAQDPYFRGLVAWHVAWHKGARLNIQVHTDLSAHSIFRHVLGQIVLRHADSIRVVSEKIKKQVEHIRVRGKISVLPVFVDVSKFHSVVRRAHASKNILWIGRFEEEKNPLQAIEVLKKVLKVEPAARLVMLGQGSMSQQISDQATHLPVNAPGWQNPLVFLDTADVVLCTSWHESWGASIIEALAAGVPVVAPDVGIAREAGAIVVDREKLAEAVIDVLQNNQKGELKLHMLNKEEWAQRWLQTL